MLPYQTLSKYSFRDMQYILVDSCISLSCVIIPNSSFFVYYFEPLPS
jgi:hypothetical protein